MHRGRRRNWAQAIGRPINIGPLQRGFERDNRGAGHQPQMKRNIAPPCGLDRQPKENAKQHQCSKVEIEELNRQQRDPVRCAAVAKEHRLDHPKPAQHQ